MTTRIRRADPLGIADSSKETIGWFRHAEIKHGRVAMAAFVGYCVQSNGITLPGNLQGPFGSTMADIPAISYADISAAGGPADQWDALPTAAKLQILGFIGFLEMWSETSTALKMDGQEHYVVRLPSLTHLSRSPDPEAASARPVSPRDRAPASFAHLYPSMTSSHSARQSSMARKRTLTPPAPAHPSASPSPRSQRGGKPGYFPKFSDKFPHPVPFDLFDPFGLSKNASPEKKERGLIVELNNGERGGVWLVWGGLCGAQGWPLYPKAGRLPARTTEPAVYAVVPMRWLAIAGVLTGRGPDIGLGIVASGGMREAVVKRGRGRGGWGDEVRSTLLRPRLDPSSAPFPPARPSLDSPTPFRAGRLAQIGIFGLISSSKGLQVPGIDGLGIKPYAGEVMAPFAAGDVSLPYVADMLKSVGTYGY